TKGAPRNVKDLKMEDIVEEQLRREMLIGSGPKFRYLDDWDMVLNSVYEVPIEYDGYNKRVGEMRLVKEVIELLQKGGFDDIKRSESRRKQLSKFTKNMQMYYDMIFTIKGKKVGYGILIYFPQLKTKDPERSRGVVLGSKCTIREGKIDRTFEKARFDDFLIGVRPYIEMIGDLYRQNKGI
ncbi:MAG: hypothetical protein ACE5KG_04530, partial [Nitrososphaerales archaeon]